MDRDCWKQRRCFNLLDPSREQSGISSFIGQTCEQQRQNKRVSFDETDNNSAVGEVEWSKTSENNKLELDLLTEMINSNTQEIDITIVNGFDANDHIGMEVFK